MSEPCPRRPDGPPFNFKDWFVQNNFKTGRPGARGDYARVGELLGYSPDYIERLVNGRRRPSPRVVKMCELIA
jgi:hypothetical protein